ncbi:hypothetical protein [Methylobacterium sp. WL64]|nr:hypothetical protein [Methylobacterium sp. WL64]
MSRQRMTLAVLAVARHLMLAKAQRLMDQNDCPKPFETHGTVYLI